MAGNTQQGNWDDGDDHNDEVGLFEEKLYTLGLDQAAVDKCKVQPADKFIGEVYSCLEHYFRSLKQTGPMNAPTFADSVYSYFSQRSTKEQSINNMFCQFAKNFEHHAQEINEYRFYKDLISQDASGKRVQIYFNIRKAILIHKQVVNYAGLQMDKLFFTFEEWSTLINRIFSPYSNLAQILHQFQTNLERLCKANHPLKQSKETMNRITMTTLIECIVECTASMESNFDKHGKHIVEERNQKQKRVASNNPPGNNPPSSRNAKENHESPLKAAQRFYEEQNQVETYNNKLFDAANELKRKRMENQQHNSSKSRDKDDRSGSRENYGQDGGRTSQGKPGASRSPIVVRKEFEDPLLEKMKEEK